MRIQHNIMAMNAYRNYTNNTSALSKNLEKLSSGYKINRAGDDAAGLAISEKMRAQITGLETAQKNAKDGISLVQTAEGALTEVHDMLNRMVELADQSANGTYDDATDRANLQKEMEQLKSEIDRIADSSNFNGIKLLDGSRDGGSAARAVSISGKIGGKTISGTTTSDVKAVYTIALGSATANSTALNNKQIDGVAITWSTNLSTTMNNFVTKYNAAGKNYTASWSGGKLTLTANKAGAVSTAPTTDIASGVGELQESVKGSSKGTSYNLSGTFQDGDSVTINGVTYTYSSQATGSDGKTFKDLTTLAAAAQENGVTLNTADKKNVTASLDAVAGNGDGLTLQIGDTSDTYNQLTVSIQDMHCAALGIDAIDIGTQTGAQDAVALIKNAINTVSSVRGDLGATQNRLDHTINNLSVMTENIQDAESTIRDTDVADEMMAYTKNNILVQSAQAMLAQANQVPQGVLQLLQ